MNAVSRECGEADRVEPEENLVVDGAGLIGDVLIALVLPPHEYEGDVCSDRRNDYKERISERGRRDGSRDDVPDDAAARSGQECQNVDAEDVHLFAHSRNGTGHRESNGAENIRDQHEKFCIHGDIIYSFELNYLLEKLCRKLCYITQLLTQILPF